MSVADSHMPRRAYRCPKCGEWTVGRIWWSGYVRACPKCREKRKTAGIAEMIV
jgi:ribosomal protein L37AE/L43A